MTSDARRFDCIVLGGGISGSVAALRLSAFGLSVCFFEGRARNEPRLVESTSSAGLAILDGLGCNVTRSTIFRPVGTRLHWGGETLELTPETSPNFVFNRTALSNVLAEIAAGSVEARHSASVRHVERISDGWRVEALTSHGTVCVTGRMAIFAGGRHGPRCGKRQRRSPVTLAVTGRFAAVRNDLAQTCVEAAPEAWYWGAPLPEGSVQITAFVAPDNHSLKSSSSIEHGLRRLVAGSKLLNALADAPLEGTVAACDASRTIVRPAIGDDFVAVGDAAFTVDPLSSQGMIKSIVSAEQGAIAVNTILRHPEMARVVKDFYLARVRDAVDWDHRMSGAHYSRQAVCTPSPFWLSRSAAQPHAAMASAERAIVTDLKLAFDATTSVAPTAVICDQLIARRPALIHPRLPRPIAFVADTPICDLLAGLPRAATAAEFVDYWSETIGRQAATRFVGLLWTNAVLVPAESRPS